MAVWLIRCGYANVEQHKEHFFADSVVVIGYGLAHPITDYATPSELRDSPDLRGRTAAGYDAGRLWRFAGRDYDDDPGLYTGDLALTPYTDAAGRRMFAIGKVTGDYRFEPTYDNTHPHARSVLWLRLDIPVTDDLPDPVLQLLNARPGFQRALSLDEADLRPFLT